MRQLIPVPLCVWKCVNKLPRCRRIVSSQQEISPWRNKVTPHRYGIHTHTHTHRMAQNWALLAENELGKFITRAPLKNGIVNHTARIPASVLPSCDICRFIAPNLETEGIVIKERAIFFLSSHYTRLSIASCEKRFSQPDIRRWRCAMMRTKAGFINHRSWVDHHFAKKKQKEVVGV